MEKVQLVSFPQNYIQCSYPNHELTKNNCLKLPLTAMSATYPLSLGHYREDFYGYIDIISLGNTFAIQVCASISLYYGYFYENSKNEKREKKKFTF